MLNTIFTAIGSLVWLAVVVIFFGLVLSLPVMLLWNYCLVGAVAGVSNIGWLQAWGIMVLCGFLFKSSTSKD
jgi:hypothetical protein